MRLFRKKAKDKLMTVAAAFNVFDSDGSGALSVDELREALTRPGGGNALSDADLQAIIDEFDANGDGVRSTGSVEKTICFSRELHSYTRAHNAQTQVMQYEEFAIMWGATDDASSKPAASNKPTDKPAAAAAAASAAAGGLGAPRKKSAESKQSIRKKEQTEAVGCLQPSADLDAAAEAELAAARSFDLKVETFGTAFHRRLGKALLENEIACKSRNTSSSASDAMNELMRVSHQRGSKRRESATTRALSVPMLPSQSCTAVSPRATARARVRAHTTRPRLTHVLHTPYTRLTHAAPIMSRSSR